MRHANVLLVHGPAWSTQAPPAERIGANAYVAEPGPDGALHAYMRIGPDGRSETLISSKMVEADALFAQQSAGVVLGEWCPRYTTLLHACVAASRTASPPCVCAQLLRYVVCGGGDQQCHCMFC